jgi:hypothetical protein
MWGYPTTLWLFIAVSVWYLVDAFVNQPKTSLIAVAISVAGIPFYFIWRATNPMPQPKESRVEETLI